jgi:predicted TIM-barrel fold metal-dependent hydrolase
MVAMMALLLSAGATPSPPAPPLVGFGVVDAHVHLMTTTNGLNYTWALDPATLSPPQRCQCAPPCNCNRTVADYQSTSSGSWRVEKVVFCEVAVAPEQWLQEASWVQALGSPLIGAIIAQPPPGFGTQPVASYRGLLDTAQADLPLLRGLRPQPLALNLTTALARAAMAEAGRRDLVVDFTLEQVALCSSATCAVCTSLQPAVDGGIFSSLLALVADTPNTTYVIEHLANPPGTNTSDACLGQWEGALQRLADLPNVGCLQLGDEVSLWQPEGRVNHTAVSAQLTAAIRIFGFSRVCFEGNFFFNDWGPPTPRLDLYGEWAGIVHGVLEQTGASEREKRLVLRDNAATIYNVALESEDEG